MNIPWWKNAVGYQIYIRSFFDSNNDGNGDLNGITAKLDYIKDLGIDFIWICPFYDSPLDDNGYDIRDYYKIHEMYGNMDDLKNLINEAHKRDIKVFADLVLNHTSDENIWFVKSEEKVEPFTNFYVWKDGIEKDGKLLPPNNWQSIFSGSAWKYSEKRKQFYLKIFSNKMPDINYEDETAFSEMEKVIDFYGKLKIDGFRVDATAHIGKDLTFKDAKNINKTFLSFSNLPNTHEYLKRFNKAFSKNNLTTMGELGGEPTKKDFLEYTTKKELDMIFSFEHKYCFSKNFKIKKRNLLKTLKCKEKLSSNSGWSVLFWLNHDYPRLISKIRGEGDPKNAQICLAGLMYMLKGTPIVYNGEEIGMTNYNFEKMSDFKDVNAQMIFENSENPEKEFEELKELTRDHSRTVMQWNDKKYGGFSKKEPWSYVNTNYKVINVENNIKDENSILNNYKKLLNIRKEYSPYLATAKYKFSNCTSLISYTIICDKFSLNVVANLSNKNKNFDFKGKQVLYSNFETNNTLTPYQFVILRKDKKI